MSNNERPSSLPNLTLENTGSRAFKLKEIAEIKDPPLTDFSEISEIIQQFKEKQKKQLILNNHKKAEETRILMERFSSHAQRSLFKRRCLSNLSDLNERLSTTESNNKQIEEITDESLKNFENLCQKKLNKLNEKQKEEIIKFENSKPLETPAKYRRRSPYLLELCRKERRLFFQSKFEDAEKLRLEIEEIEKIESENAFKASIEAWEIEGKHLKEKHEKELNALNQWINIRREEENLDKNRQIESIQKRKKLLDGEINTQKNIMRSSIPHLIRRNLLYDSSKLNFSNTLNFNNSIDIKKLSSTLPPKSKEILHNF